MAITLLLKNTTFIIKNLEKTQRLMARTCQLVLSFVIKENHKIEWNVLESGFTHKSKTGIIIIICNEKYI